eukprot:16444217-Heterocapsa_arctica.AAC.1
MSHHQLELECHVYPAQQGGAQELLRLLHPEVGERLKGVHDLIAQVHLVGDLGTEGLQDNAVQTNGAALLQQCRGVVYR